MTFKCLFKKMHIIAQDYGVDAQCAPKNFNQLWCLVDKVTSVVEAGNLELEQNGLLNLEQGGLLDL